MSIKEASQRLTSFVRPASSRRMLSFSDFSQWECSCKIRGITRVSWPHLRSAFWVRMEKKVRDILNSDIKLFYSFFIIRKKDKNNSEIFINPLQQLVPKSDPPSVLSAKPHHSPVARPLTHPQPDSYLAKHAPKLTSLIYVFRSYLSKNTPPDRPPSCATHLRPFLI